MNRMVTLDTLISDLLREILPHPDSVRRDRKLSEQGLDSMTATRLWLELQARFNARVPLEWLAGRANPDELVAYIAAERSTGASPQPNARLEVRSDPHREYDPFPLTPMQEAYLIGSQQELADDAVGCHQYLEFALQDPDLDRLRNAWQRLVDHHPMLRMTVDAGGTPRVMREASSVRIEVQDCTSQDQTRVEQIRRAITLDGHELGGRPPFTIAVSRMDSGKAIVHLDLDMLVTDGHGLAILLQQWHACYRDPNHILPKIALSPRDCLIALHSQLCTEKYRGDLAHWLDALRDMPGGPEMTPLAAAPASASRCTLEGALSAETWSALRRKAGGLDISPSTLVLAAFAQALCHSNRHRPCSIIVTTSLRPWLPPEAEELVGQFTSSAIIVLDKSARPLEETAQRLQQKLWTALEHGAASGVTVLRELRRRDAQRTPTALPVVFTSLIGAGPRGGQDEGFGKSITFAACRTSGIALDHQLWEQNGELRYCWDVIPTRFATGCLETMFAMFENFLTTLCCPTPLILKHRSLNDLQQAYYVSRASDPQTPWNGCQIYKTFDVEDFDVNKLERALLRFIENREALRTAVGANGLLVARDQAPQRWRIPTIDLDGAADSAAALAAIREEMAGRAFLPGSWPPFDIRATRRGTRTTVHCCFDLAVFDARSIHILCRQLFRLYQDPEAPLPVTAPELTAEGRKSAHDEIAMAERHWRERLQRIPPGPVLPAAHEPGACQRRVRLHGRLAGWGRLEQRATEHGVTCDAMLLAAFLEAISATLGSEPIVVPVVRFPQSEDQHSLGERTALSWVERVTTGSLPERAAAYQEVIDRDASAAAASGLGELRRRVMRERSKREFSFPIVYTTIVDLTAWPLPAAVRQGEWLSCTPDVALDCIGIREGDDLFYAWDAVERDFLPGQLSAMFGDYRRRLEHFVRPHMPNADEAATTHGRFAGVGNPVATYFPADRLLHQLFEDRTAERPDAIALRGSAWKRSYAELNRAANEIAWCIRRQGVRPQDVVGVAVPPGHTMIAACLGILKASAIYLPIDPSLPGERVSLLLSEAGATTLLTTTAAERWQVPLGVRIIDLDGVQPDASDQGKSADTNPHFAGGPDSIAYVIFTSGSTGKPKGVAVTHRAVLNLLHWCARSFDFTTTDAGLCVTSLSFDLSVFDIFGLLGVGASLYVADDVERADPQLLLEIMVTSGITFWNSAPIFLSQMTPLLASARGKVGTDALRLVFLSGDYTPLSLPDEIRAVFPNARIVVLGGATEATVWSNFFPVQEIDPSWRSIPYGWPIDNSRYHVLDSNLMPCPVGIEGDLYIGGECLSIGYYNRPDLTAAQFIPDPFADTPGQRLYRTGDRASYFPDGCICFRGRIDRQVKIRGHRVELSEIEHRLRQHPAVKDAVVLVRSDTTGDAKLVAYIVTSCQLQVDVAELRAFTACALPDYMVPNHVAFLDVFPVTMNGKLDRKALPWPPNGNDAAAAPQPVDELEKEVSFLFATMLGVPQFDPAQEIWDQGATSFTVLQVSNKIHERYGRRIPISIVLAEPTARGIARWVATEPKTGTVSAAPALDAGPSRLSGAPPEPIEFFSGEERRKFKESDLGSRQLSPSEPLIPLDTPRIAEAYYGWRASRRDWLTGEVPRLAFCQLLGLLRDATIEDRHQRLYPSAGDTFAVQVYVHVRPGRVESIAHGVYYYRPKEHMLQLVRSDPEIGRNVHFYYNRPLFDTAAFELYLIGQCNGIEPIYRENAERYLALEAGHIAQLLMMGQAACGIGLCPIGEVTFEPIRRQLGLDNGHRFLLAMLGGPAKHQLPAFGSDRPPFAEQQSLRKQLDVAIIGLSGRYAGADDPEALWKQLLAGSHAIGPPPEQRRIPGNAREVNAAYLQGIDQFDGLLFNVSPAEARAFGPQLRLLLEAAWTCLENAGHSPASLRRAAGRVGVIVGVMWHDYSKVGGGEAVVAGSGSDIANRISQSFGFDGPSLAVDAACTSSLTAIHLAAASLQRRECGAVIVCAANTLADPYHLALLSELGMIATSEQGAFDVNATGWVPGEGVAAVLLRPAAAAVSDGDVIHGVIEATGVGHASELGAADSEALANSINRMLEQHDLSAADISYVECAAAGAGVADAAEIEAFARVFGKGERGATTVGTLKANIGHLEAAAGLSQLTKVLLQMRHGLIAPMRMAPRRNPLVDWDSLPLRPADRVEAWQPSLSGTRRALINAVGADGAYAHLIVCSPPERKVEMSRAGDHIVVLSADSQSKLVTLAQRLRDHVATCHRRGEIIALEDIAYTLQTGRTPLAHRLAISCADVPTLLARIDDFVRGDSQRDNLVGKAADWIAGRAVDWLEHWDRPARRVALPSYPFARASHWIAPSPVAVNRNAGSDASTIDVAGHPAREIEDRLLEAYSEVSGIPRAKLDPRVPLEHYGLSSLLAKQFSAVLKESIGTVPPTLLYRQRTLAEIADQLSGDGVRFGRQHRYLVAPAAGADRQPKPAQHTRSTDIAIIGIAGRFPQARDLEQFWANLTSGRDCITALPPERKRDGWPVGLMWGGYLEDIDKFDCSLFQIPPRDAALMDPQARLFLEVVWETLEDAHYPAQRLRESHQSRVGVFVGSMYNEYPFFGVERSLAGEHVSSGAGLADIANRISYFFDFHGPSLTVDTLCSSSLTSIHLAVESLRLGDCDAAIAGGVNLSLHPNKFIEQDRHGMPSSDHRCRSFGADGDGFVPGEGVGAVLLKKLDRALADEDRIHAVIKGTAINHGGRTNGYMVPSPMAQAEVIRAALRDAGLHAADIGYIEAHGTGTELGDPIEIDGLEQAFANANSAVESLPIGSVKSSIGHLEGAAGIASLAKVVLQFRHKQFVPSLHAEALNPNVDWARSPFYVQRQPAEWRTPFGDDGRALPRRAGISGFGAGGANAHLILEEHIGATDDAGSTNGTSPQLILLSAADKDRLRVVAGELATFLAESQPPLSDIAYTLQVGRAHLRERLAIVAASHDELTDKLNKFCDGAVEGITLGTAATDIAASCKLTRLSLPEITTPLECGKQWVMGNRVEASRLHGRSKPRLIDLPHYPMRRSRHWLPWESAGRKPTRSASACEKTWRPVTGDFSTPPDDGPVLCFFHGGSEAIARHLAEEAGPNRVILLDARQTTDGLPGFSDVASGLATMEIVLARYSSISAWVDLCDLDDNQPEQCLARLAMLQRLLGSRPTAKLRVLHVTRGLQNMQGPPPRLVGARIAGFIRVLRSEHGHVAATTMDTDLTEHDAAAASRQIVAELRCRACPEVCYRNGERYRPQLSEIAIPAARLRLDPGKIYLVTGGTRGLGSLAARRLVERGARRIALMGLRPLPDRSDWDNPALSPDQIEVIRNLRELERAGATIEIHCGPLTERTDVDGFLKRLRKANPIGGILHCAGRMSPDPMPFCRREPSELQSTFGAKVDGLEILADLCAHDRPAFFLLYSSIAAYFPALAAGVADYAAANAFLDWFADYQARMGRHWFRSVAWPSWRDGDTSAPPASYSKQGLDELDPERGLDFLESALCRSSGGALLAWCPSLQGDLAPSALLEIDDDQSAHEIPVSRWPHEENPAVPDWLRTLFAESLGMQAHELDPDIEFGELGIESVLLVELLNKLESRMGRTLEPAILLEHPTLARLSAQLFTTDLSRESTATPVASLNRPLSEEHARSQISVNSSETDRKIAVIGVACRFPGAANVDEFWANLRVGKCSITEIPRSRWAHQSMYRPHFQLGSSISKWGGFIEGIEDFDPSYFQMEDEEATCLDPAIRLMLEGAETCLADAGYERQELWGRNVGVFAGARISDYWRRAGIRRGSAGFGADQNFIAARVSHHLNLTGPSLLLDSACSSSLVALQTAARSLLCEESELALVGGVEVLLDERPYLEFSAAGALSPTGQCRVFDERADGFVPAEGCGVVLLKRLSDALRDGDRVRAVIEFDRREQ